MIVEPPSHWYVTLDAPPVSDELPATCDVVVVGGGLLGAATSYWLARSGATIALIERGELAAGATGRNGGLIVPGLAEAYPQAIERFGHVTARTLAALTYQSVDLLRDMLRDEDISCDYRPHGHLHLALSDDELAAFERVADALRADGFAAETLDRQHVQARIATPLGDEIVGGLLNPEGAMVHSARLVAGLAAAAQRRGARLCTATPVRAIERDGAGLRVSTERGVVRAQAAVVAVNAWTDTLVPALRGVIVPVRGQVVAYEPLPAVFNNGLSVDITPTGEYWQQTSDGALVLGGCRAVAPGGEVGLRECYPEAAIQTALEQVFPRLFPRLGGLRVARRWAGPMAFTPDYLPIIDRAPNLPNVWMVGGFSGHGMPFGAKIGQLLAEAALTNASPAALAPFRHARPTLHNQMHDLNVNTSEQS